MATVGNVADLCDMSGTLLNIRLCSSHPQPRDMSITMLPSHGGGRSGSGLVQRGMQTQRIQLG